MGDVDSGFLRDFVIVVIFIGAFILAIIRTVHMLKAKPSTETNLGTIATKLAHIEKAVEEKQDETLCNQLHKDLKRDLDRVETRHAAFESKISHQFGGSHARMDEQTKAIAANGAKLETFMDEVRGWRNRSHA